MDTLMLPEDIATGMGEDVVSGQALPLLFDLASYPIVWSPAWSILLLCLIIGVSAIVSFALRDTCDPQNPQTPTQKPCCPWDTVAGILLSCVKIWLSATMLFKLVAALDPDVGVRLCVIPLLFLLSTQHGDPTTYRTRMHLALVGATAVLLVYASVDARPIPASPPPLDASVSNVITSSAWVMVDAVFACGYLDGPTTLVRAAFFCVFTIWRETITRYLLAMGATSRAHVAIHGTLLLLMCGLHSSQIRAGVQRLGVHRPIRPTILLNAFAILCALEFNWIVTPNRWASYVALAITIIRGVRTLTRPRET